MRHQPAAQSESCSPVPRHALPGRPRFPERAQPCPPEASFTTDPWLRRAVLDDRSRVSLHSVVSTFVGRVPSHGAFPLSSAPLRLPTVPFRRSTGAAELKPCRSRPGKGCEQSQTVVRELVTPGHGFGRTSFGKEKVKKKQSFTVPSWPKSTSKTQPPTSSLGGVAAVWRPSPYFSWENQDVRRTSVWWSRGPVVLSSGPQSTAHRLPLSLFPGACQKMSSKWDKSGQKGPCIVTRHSPLPRRAPRTGAKRCKKVQKGAKKCKPCFARYNSLSLVPLILRSAMSSRRPNSKPDPEGKQIGPDLRLRRTESNPNLTLKKWVNSGKETVKFWCLDQRLVSTNGSEFRDLFYSFIAVYHRLTQFNP